MPYSLHNIGKLSQINEALPYDKPSLTVEMRHYDLYRYQPNLQVRHLLATKIMRMKRTVSVPSLQYLFPSYSSYLGPLLPRIKLDVQQAMIWTFIVHVGIVIAVARRGRKRSAEAKETSSTCETLGEKATYTEPINIVEPASVLKPWKYPSPSPDHTFDIEKTSPPKFRAFRYAYTRHTIEVRKLDKDSWVLLDSQFPRYHEAKVARLAARGREIVDTLPWAQAAAVELCQDLSEFLCRRYPHIYNVVRTKVDRKGWYDEGSILKIEIPSIGAAYDLALEDALTVAGLIQPADLNVLIKQDDDQYKLSGMMLGIGGRQRLKDKLGQTLANLHLGQVPHYAEQLQRPLDRLLSKLKVENPVCRNTTAISIHDEFYWPTQTMGPEEDWDPSVRGPGLNTLGYTTFKPPQPVTSISQIFFRQERHTLRRLPKSQAIVWAVHTYIMPIEEILDEPGVPGRLASLIRSWNTETAEYCLPIERVLYSIIADGFGSMCRHKGRKLYDGVLLPHLDKLHSKQVKNGLCEEGEMPSLFPF